MPNKPKEFSYEIKQGQQIFDDPLGRCRFLAKKPDGYRGFESHHKPRQSKSNPQLGYYWGLLVIEITKRLNAMGWTVKFCMGDHSFERYYAKEDAHEWLKEHCAKVGDDGVYVTLSEQDEESCSRYITNVLWVAEYWLEMDVEALKAKRPEINKGAKDNEPKEVGQIDK